MTYGLVKVRKHWVMSKHSSLSMVCAALAIVQILTSAACAQEVARALPPSDELPRLPEEWATHQSAEQGRASFAVAFPEHATNFEALRLRLGDLANRHTAAVRSYSPAFAHELIDELFVDRGHPRLNAVSQDQIVLLIRSISVNNPDLQPRVRQIFAGGLAEYLRAGGGDFMPSTLATCGALLAELSPESADHQALADDTIVESLGWANVVGDLGQLKNVQGEASRQWGAGSGGDFQLEFVDRTTGELPKACMNAQNEISRVTREPDWKKPAFVDQLRKATELACDCDKRTEARTNVIEGLLQIYHRVLADKRDKHDGVGELICDRLSWFAAKPGRVGTERAWLAWLNAARVSLRFNRCPELPRAIRELLREAERYELTELTKTRLSVIAQSMRNHTNDGR